MPASARQIAANRLNGAKGGPKTPEGRAAGRFNALRHGLAAVEIILPGEDRSHYEELRHGLLEDLAPSNTYEEALAGEVVRSYWRLMRLRGVETAMLTHHIEIRAHLSADTAMAQAFMEEPWETFRVYFRYDSVIERSYYRALQQFHRAKKQVSDTGTRSVLQPSTSSRLPSESRDRKGVVTMPAAVVPQHLVSPSADPQNSVLHPLYNSPESVYHVGKSPEPRAPIGRVEHPIRLHKEGVRLAQTQAG